MFESGKLEINQEVAERAREVLQKNEKVIESVIEDAGKHLGEGRTAKVCFCGDNNELCIKIYKNPNEIFGVDFYLDPSKEMKFLGKLRGLDSEARVPDALACFEGDTPELNFMIMETLPAVSVDDVLQGRAELPENFNLGAFLKDLEDFVEKMHEMNIYHRDLHEGNIMIDKSTGKPYVIDFGAAGEFYGRVEALEPGEAGPYHIRKEGRYIKLTSDEAMIRSTIKKLADSLTKVN